MHMLPQNNGPTVVAEYNGRGLNEYAGLQLKMTDVTDLATGVMISTGEIFDPKGK